MDRFWQNVAKGVGCWLWLGRKDKDGYGDRISFNGKRVRAHRVSVLLSGRTIPAGMQIDHLCRNRACVNPAHLEVVTPAENNLRGFGCWRQRRDATHCKHGHPFDEVNTYRRPNGQRDCRTCIRARARAYYARVA